MYYLECLFPPYDTRQATEIAEKIFLVARNKRPQREEQTLRDRLTVLLDKSSSACLCKGSPITIGTSVPFYFFSVSLYRDDGK